jgi:NADPH-dependent 2,4-dienoyl-CoA reductase/sulfur reductase-like enzyme
MKWLPPVGHPDGRSRLRRSRRRARWARGTEPRPGARKEWRMADHVMVVAGGGPTGLMLAGELAVAGVDVAIVERRAS